MAVFRECIHFNCGRLAGSILICFTLFTSLNRFISSVEARECKSIDIRNNAQSFRQLENCTIITGFLQIVLIEQTPNEEFTNLSYPQLREITGFLLFFRVRHLKSIAGLFPNLTVIRGQRLLTNYALIIYDMHSLEEIGLKSLISIQRGFVKISMTPRLCYATTIDWSKITTQGPNSIEINTQYQCPTNQSCRGCTPQNCWSSKNCQRFYKGAAYAARPKCHEQCLGGCTNRTAKGCYTCLGAVNNGECVEQCPDHKVLDPETLRCITMQQCAYTRRIIFQNQCFQECPPGFTVVEDMDIFTNRTFFTCIECLEKCPKVCLGAEVLYLSDAEQLTGCTVINGSLQIRMNIDVPNMMIELEKCMGNIEEIRGFLKIYRSLSVTSLSFLKSLIKIDGSELEFEKYAFVLYENNNLQRLFNWSTKERIEIAAGSLMLHYNNKLCNTEIRRLQEITNYNNTHDFISVNSNGYLHSCDIIPIQTTSKVDSYENVTISWEPFHTDPDTSLIGYIVFYIESPNTDVIPEMTSPCSRYSWTSVMHEQNDASDANEFQMNLTGLTPHTQYAYFIQTYTIAKGQTAQSSVRYFRTFANKLHPPELTLHHKTSKSVTIRWKLKAIERDLITQFAVEIVEHEDNQKLLDERDFCEWPRVVETDYSPYIEPDCCSKLGKKTFDFEDDVDDEPDIRRWIHGDQHCKYKERKDEGFSLADCYDDDNEDNFGKRIHEVAQKFSQRTSGRTRRESSNAYKSVLQSQTFNGTVRNGTISNLKPFTMYTFYVYSCHQSDCSTFEHITDRTLPEMSSDDVVFTLNIEPITNELHIVVNPPNAPNGLTVAFEIEQKQVDLENAKELRKCFTRKEFEAQNYTYIVKHLHRGTFSFRARSVSLAGYGKFTEWIYTSIRESSLVPDNNPLNMWTISFGVLLLIGMSIAGIVYARKRRRQTKPEDCVILMSEISTPHAEDEDWNIGASTSHED